jgi:hypothetical protein
MGFFRLVRGFPPKVHFIQLPKEPWTLKHKGDLQKVALFKCGFESTEEVKMIALGVDEGYHEIWLIYFLMFHIVLLPIP